MLEFLQPIDEYLKHFLPQALALFTHISWGVIGGGGLLLVMCVSAWVFLKRARRVSNELDEAIKVINSSHDEASFTEEYETINQKLENNRLVGHLWSEFTETLIPPMEDIDDPSYRVYRNTKRPGTFFTYNSLFPKVTPLVRGETYIGLGLIFTFIGLVAALTESSNAFDGDSTEIKAALAGLLSVAGAKFLASVGGLLSSIIQSIVVHRRQTLLISKLSAFNNALEGRLVYASMERIAADQYIHAQRQTRRLEELSNDIAMSLGDRIERSVGALPDMFGDQMRAVMEPVSASLSSVSDSMSQANQDAMGQMAKEFHDQMQGASSEVMDNVLGQLEGVSRSMTDMMGSIGDVRESLTSGVTAASSSMNDATENMAGTITELVNKMQSSTLETTNSISSQFEEAMGRTSGVISQAAERASQEMESTVKEAFEGVNQQIIRSIDGVEEVLNSWKESTQQVSSSLNGMNEQLGRNNQHLSDSASTLGQAVDAFKQVPTQVRSAVEPLSRVSVSLTEAITEMAAVGDALSDAGDEMKDSTEQMGDTFTQLVKTWEAQTEQLQGADQELATAFETIKEGMRSNMNTFNDFNQQTINGYADAIKQLNGLVAEIKDTVEDLADNLNG